LIHLHNISKTFPDKVLFQGLDLVIKPGIRAGLVGPNGSGKTTLFKLIIGQEEPEHGTLQIAGKISLGYLPQEITTSSNKLILHEVLDQFPEIGQLEGQIESLSADLAADPENESLLAKLGRCQAEFDRLDGWSLESRAKKVLGGLGFSPEQMQTPLEQFSGGWRMRVALAKLLFKQPDILLLDEPTNHLDLASLIWLEEFLLDTPGSLLLISHDRSFLDKVVQQIFEISHGKIQTHAGNFSNFLAARELRVAQQAAAYKNQQKLIIEIERFIERFRYKDSKASQVQSRVKALAKLERIYPPESAQRQISVRVPQPQRSPRILAEFKLVDKCYGTLEVFKQLELVIERGQKIGLVGPNGAGKSTLLKTVAGFLQPLSGDVYLGSDSLKTLGLKKMSRLVSVVLTDRFSDLYLTAFDVVRMGRFPYASFFGRLKTEDLAFIHQTMDKLGVGGFKEKLFYNLSDGERQKVLIARALVQDTPFLFLDEPVAFIDSPGRIEIMELLSELAHQQGKAILMTTHDMETALHYADTLWLMHRGKQLVAGIPEDMVLQGKVGEYFQRPGLHFDVEKGRFRAENKSTGHLKTISIQNDSSETTWLVRALERNGFVVKEANSIPENGLFVEYGNGNFRLFQDAKSVGAAQSIAEVLRKLEDVWGDLTFPIRHFKKN